MIATLDIGASTTKGILADESLRIIGKSLVTTGDPEVVATYALKNLLDEFGSDYKVSIRFVAISGGGSRFIGQRLLDIPVKRVDEIKAIGLGGLHLTRKPKGLVVSIGTGTAMVVARENGKDIKHIGGTGVGGGTIIGLSKRMLGIDKFEILENMASKGRAEKVDLTVADIVGGPIGMVPAEATASNFGRLNGEAEDNDIAAAIFNMVSQVIGVVASMAAKAHNLEDDVIIVGMLAKSRIISKILHETTDLFGVKIQIPQDCEYCTALGAAYYASIL